MEKTSVIGPKLTKLYRLFSNCSLKTKMIMSMVLISLVPTIAIGYIAHNNALNTIEKQQTIYSMNLLNQMKSKIEDLVESADKISLQIMARAEVQNYNSNMSDNATYNINYFGLSNYISMIEATHLDIASIFVCLKDLGIISPHNFGGSQSRQYQKYAVYQMGLKSLETASASGLHRNEFRSGTEYVLTLSRAAFSNNNTEPVGAIIVNIAEKTIANACQSSAKQDMLYIIDSSGKVIYSPDSSQYTKILDKPYCKSILGADDSEGMLKLDIDDSEKYVRYLYSASTKWFYIAEIDINESYVQSWKTIGASALIIFSSVVFTVLMSLFLATSLIKPIKKLVESIRYAVRGDFSGEIDISSGGEIGILSASYNNMLREIKNLLERVKEEERQKRQSDLDFLQAQITPHFIYNFLNTIKAISYTHGEEKIYNLTTGLTGLLRTSISNKSIFIRVEEEIRLVKGYLYLQQVRCENEFEVVYEIDTEVEKLMTLKMLLQPIVENAVIHGFNLQKSNNILIIRAYIKSDTLYFVIEDNGRGMSEEKVTEILSTSGSHGVSGNFSGIAIKNIKERLEMYFGEEYTIHFRCRVGYGTKVTVTLPVIADEKECERYV